VSSTISATPEVALSVHLKVTHCGHVGLNVNNLDRSKDFYKKVFGLQIIGESADQGHRFAFLGDGERLVLTLWQQSTGKFDPGKPGLHHLSFQVADIHELGAVEERLRQMNIPVLHGGIVAHAENTPSGAVFFEDPDGIRLEIFSPSGAGGYRPATAKGPSCGFF
jgi:lactoylglutathione lyase